MGSQGCHWNHSYLAASLSKCSAILPKTTTLFSMPDPVLLFTLRDQAATVSSIIGRHLRVILQGLQELPLDLEHAHGDSRGLEFRDVLTLQLGVSVTFSCFSR